ncbi:hypothetical protein FNV43_RR02170 [Rhamnella rubrinervis]|uniref:non-specific serine/threonine protein kinase n=1 Tax=Rhamnella rubrinervis TaxID=2594499 RepID=A0A8K0HR64_9ROSA|nr:hypothetical protein FNV43_RR02170 [Rhamnella rubrinervis]
MMAKRCIRRYENFDSKYCIGVGGYGTAYKALLSTDQVVAVNKFHENDEPASPEAFTDISSNNVFLDAHEARFADFGSASILVPESSSSWSSFAGTLVIQLQTLLTMWEQRRSVTCIALEL